MNLQNHPNFAATDTPTIFCNHNLVPDLNTKSLRWEQQGLDLCSGLGRLIANSLLEGGATFIGSFDKVS